MSVVQTSRMEVDRAACAAVAQWIAAHEIPRDAEETCLQGFSSIEVGDFYLFLVAICHQTSPQGLPPVLGTVNGQLRRGWDYLLNRFEQLARQDRSLLSLAWWEKLSGAQLEEWFADPEYGRRLVAPERRAELVRDLAAVMNRRGWRHAQDVYDASGGWIAAQTPNLLGMLSGFAAYRDPVQKKSFYLLSLLKNNGIWSYRDPESLGAPVDYHEVRGHLRLGTVRICSPQLRRKIVEH
ncbi:MAG: hypothetical protein JNG90_09305, partial [Planctomycetaceae bacterium]|nr:hypothetical protein [Planctomycetaceae bacterium]